MINRTASITPYQWCLFGYIHNKKSPPARAKNNKLALKLHINFLKNWQILVGNLHFQGKIGKQDQKSIDAIGQLQ